jgi:hypothetical protein
MKCLLGGKTPNESEKIVNIFDISIDGREGNPGDGNEGCFVNYMTIIKYSPEREKVASWDIGQAENFENFEDLNISDSFEFL